MVLPHSWLKIIPFFQRLRPGNSTGRRPVLVWEFNKYLYSKNSWGSTRFWVVAAYVTLEGAECGLKLPLSVYEPFVGSNHRTLTLPLNLLRFTPTKELDKIGQPSSPRDYATHEQLKNRAVQFCPTLSSPMFVPVVLYVIAVLPVKLDAASLSILIRNCYRSYAIASGVRLVEFSYVNEWQWSIPWPTLVNGREIALVTLALARTANRAAVARQPASGGFACLTCVGWQLSITFM